MVNVTCARDIIATTVRVDKSGGLDKGHGRQEAEIFRLFERWLLLLLLLRRRRRRRRRRQQASQTE
jgi:hypothetical protein